MPGEAELIMFAIRSAIKLGQQSREAYVDATRRRELVHLDPGARTMLTPLFHPKNPEATRC